MSNTSISTEHMRDPIGDSVDRGAWKGALKAAFPYTIPILAGFIFLGITCGIYSVSLGLPWWTPTLMVVIFMDQWLKDRQHLSALAGAAASVAALLAFGPDNFMIPAMLIILLAVTALRARIEPAYATDQQGGAHDAAASDAPEGGDAA